MKKLLLIALLAVSCSKSDKVNTPDASLSGKWTATATYKDYILSPLNNQALAHPGEVKKFDIKFNADGTGTISRDDYSYKVKYSGSSKSFYFGFGEMVTNILFSETFSDGDISDFDGVSFKSSNKVADVIITKD